MGEESGERKIAMVCLKGKEKENGGNRMCMCCVLEEIELCAELRRCFKTGSSSRGNTSRSS